MDIELKRIPIRDLVEKYVDNDEEGVIGYGGKLNIRPKYQREFVYQDKQRDAVIETLRKDFPLNVMYWVDNGNDTFEVLDGQQRIISVCKYVTGKFSLNVEGNIYYFHTLTEQEKKEILDYELMIYFCEGNDKEKLDWFKTINIAGEKLTDQELRNAIYTGEWLTDAKRHFSKTGCPAYGLASNYMSGSPIRQEYLEAAISWISDDNIEDYMAKHQNETNANELWLYFQKVINWIEATFPNYRKEMKGVQFGFLYNEFKDKKLDPKKLETEIDKLMKDDDVTKKKGIYSYVLNGKEKELSIRAFTSTKKSTIYARQRGICKSCEKKFEQSEMEADHIIPWSKGGKTELENCQMLCTACNREKSAR